MIIRLTINEFTLARIGRSVAEKALELDPAHVDGPNFERIAEAAQDKALAMVHGLIDDLQTDPGLKDQVAREILAVNAQTKGA